MQPCAVLRRRMRKLVCEGNVIAQRASCPYSALLENIMQSEATYTVVLRQDKIMYGTFSFLRLVEELGNCYTHV